MADLTLAHEEHGPPAGTPVVLLHGFPLARGMWGAQIEPLTRAGYRLILPDLRGHGESPVADEAGTIHDFSDDVEQLLEDLGVERFVLGGFSLGGYVALEFARHHMERLMGLALIDTRAEPDTEDARKKRYGTAAQVRKEGIGVLERAMLPKLLSDATRAKRADLVDTVRTLIRGTLPEGAAQALEAMAERPDQRPYLVELRMPALVAVGEKDELTPPASSRLMADALPHARLLRLPGAAHLSPLEASQEFNPAFLDWLRSLRNGDGAARSGRARTASRSQSAASP